MDNRRKGTSALEKIHTGLSLKFRLLSPLFPILSLTQVTPYLRVAFCLRVRSSSYSRNFPSCSTVRRKVASIGLVKQSANMMAVETHLQMVCSLDCSFKSITSIVVRHSWQFGTAFFVIKSYKDLQSVIIKPLCSFFKEVSGRYHWKIWIFDVTPNTPDPS